MIEFKSKSKVTAIDVSIWIVLWEYICWKLAGKPEKYLVRGKNVRQDN